MMRSLFSGVSGLQNHQIRMDVIGNNIANVNTVGFKGSRATFKETLSQTLISASAPDPGRNLGGINPCQIGLGVGLSSIDVIHSPSGTQSTNSETDLAVEGTGFFIVADGAKQYYTRAGMMEFDGAGTLVSKSNGLPVMGYLANEKGEIVDTGGQLQHLRITSDIHSISPVSTSSVVLNGNVSAFTENGESLSRIATVYDSLGATHRVIITFEKNAPNNWSWSAKLENDSSNTQLGPTDPAERVLSFNDDGTVLAGNIGNIIIPSTLLEPGQAEELEFELDLNGVRQFAEDNSLVVQRQNGFPSGDLDGISIDQSGILIGSYSNGLIKHLGQVALARFENPPGLLKVGDTMFEESVNSGNPVIGLANTGGFGSIMSNSLEMSNVDLSEEFTEMIITQRGFQANSRVITSADEMLQELVNLKR